MSAIVTAGQAMVLCVVIYLVGRSATNLLEGLVMLVLDRVFGKPDAGGDQ